MSDAAFIAEMERLGYVSVRKAESGEWIGLHRFIFTIGLCVGLQPGPFMYRTRFCYELLHAADAIQAIVFWDGQGDPPGQWIKEKGEVERCNPNYCEGCFLPGCHKRKGARK